MSGIYLQEFFSSVQGEGPFVGCRQVFIRLAGCNWTCAYCDTPTDPAPETWVLEKTPGCRDFMTLPNPVEPQQLAEIVACHYDLTLHHSVSLTGGEPLLHTHFLKELIPRISGTRAGIFLETNGTLPGELSSVIHCIDIVSMDIKLESSTKTKTPWDVHKEFLAIASQKKVYVKVVISAATKEAEIEQTGKLIGSIDPEIELILQPVTAKGGIGAGSVDRVLKFQEQALKVLKNVRVIPQTHLMMGQL